MKSDTSVYKDLYEKMSLSVRACKGNRYFGEVHIEEVNNSLVSYSVRYEGELNWLLLWEMSCFVRAGAQTHVR